MSRRVLIALVVCTGSVVGAVFVVNSYIDDEIDGIPRVPLVTSSVETNGVNFLIVGSDSRAFVEAEGGVSAEQFGDPDVETGKRSDTMMVLHANGDRSFAVSFPRDTWVTFPDADEGKINGAFNDGPQAVVDTLQQNFDLAVNHYLEVDFRSFEGLVDAIGGVPVYFEHITRDQMTGLLNPFPKFCNVLDGGQALAYVRSRFPEHYVDGEWVDAQGLGDFDRINRQQDFVKRLGRVAAERATDDPTLAPGLADAVIPTLRADEGFDRDAFNELARALLTLSAGTQTTIEFATLPTDREIIGGQDAQVLTQPAAEEMLRRLRGEVVADPAPEITAPVGHQGGDTGPEPSGVRVTVRNGSGVQNAARDALNDLADHGFVLGQALDDPRGSVAKTEIRYRSGDKARADLVASYVDGGAVEVEDDALAGDVVLVLGANFGGINATPITQPAGEVPPPRDTPEAACQ